MLVGCQARGAMALLKRTQQRLHSLHGLLRKLLERLHQSTDSAADPTRDARHHLLDHLCGLLIAHTLHLPRGVGILRREFARGFKGAHSPIEVFKSAGLDVVRHTEIGRGGRCTHRNTGRRMLGRRHRRWWRT